MKPISLLSGFACSTFKSASNFARNGLPTMISASSQPYFDASSKCRPAIGCKLSPLTHH